MNDPDLTRRHLLQGAVAAGAAAALAGVPQPAGAEEKTVTKGNIKQSIVFWCFNSAGEKWDVEKTCQVAKALGCVSVEIVEPEHWPTLKKHGLTCAIAPNGMPGWPFMKGFNNPKYHEQVIASTKKMIDACAEAGVPSVIAFSGYKWRDSEDPKSGEITRDEGADNCVKGFKQILP